MPLTTTRSNSEFTARSRLKPGPNLPRILRAAALIAEPGADSVASCEGCFVFWVFQGDEKILAINCGHVIFFTTHMKILLQHTGSGLFFKSLDSWVRDETEARIFGTALSAIEFCERHGISAAQIILRPETSQDEIRVGPITPPGPTDIPRV